MSLPTRHSGRDESGLPTFLDRERFPVDEWVLRERQFSSEDQGTTETLFAVGNGYLGMRGNVEEGRESHAHGTFINGFHETWPIQHAEEAYGFARVGQTIVNVPDAKIIRLYVDDEPLLLPVADLLHYERSIDYRDGVLRREIDWRTPSGKRVRISTRRMVSIPERHLAIMTYEVTMLDADAPVTISSQILNRQDGGDEYDVKDEALGAGFDPRRAKAFEDRVLVPRRQDADGGRYLLGYQCRNSGMTLAVAADHQMETENEVHVTGHIEPDLAKHVYRIRARQGVPIKLTKVVSYHTSRGVPTRELQDRCYGTLNRVVTDGVDGYFDAQRDWLTSFWERSDVVVHGQSATQQAVRWNLFQIAQAAARAEGSGIPAKGVSGSGYSGHYFWDAEVYVLPFLTYTMPRAARNALRFRYQMLEAAIRRAGELNQTGALFPWRTINGEEASAYYAAGTAQYHIDADIAYALRQYVTATGDEDFLAREGIDVLVQTARLWADLGFWRGRPGQGTFHIHGVTGPDEYTTVVNDNLYTNVMARFNLRAGAESVRALAEKDPGAHRALVKRLNLSTAEVDGWALAAEGMHIPFDERVGIHPQDAMFLEKEMWDLENTPAERRPLLLYYHPLVIYRFQVLKQADVVLALFLQGHEFTPEEKRADFDYYDPLTTGDSTLSGVVQSIMAAEVGYQELALEHFGHSLYVDLADLHANAADGVHVASTGGIWSALVFGFGGVRDSSGHLTIDPRLPELWEGLTYRLTIDGARLRVDLRQEEITLSIEHEDAPDSAITLEVRGEEVTVTAAEPVTVPLGDQGPRLIGAPGVRDLEGLRREDGTMVRATVPEARSDEHVDEARSDEFYD
ncbi:glycoside hydrolase family 65 protein [Bogoriella caseilytica]|uniref:Alpha,alpha-trehalose phosphorylase n=1 Tax=Bogoriella caseilytica TaxID=56055 RepID=A0A3N2BG63_9MICO|nr:glycosyl hydrolase family 65 protein [Bogoriella caseilytica]ROR74237.1 alpha,alpha-trehalose phosphorylase [Bogoriella caseilytica]